MNTEGLIHNRKRQTNIVRRREGDEAGGAATKKTRTSAIQPYEGSSSGSARRDLVLAAPERKTDLQSPTLALKGHRDEVTSCAFDTQGNLLASASYDTTVMLWKVGATTQEVGTLKGHFNAVLDITMMDTQLVSVGADNGCVLWDVKTGSKVRRYKTHENRVNAVDSLEHLFVTVSDDACVRVFDDRLKEEQHRLSRKWPALSVGINDYFFLVGELSGDLVWYDQRKLDEPMMVQQQAHSDAITGLYANTSFVVSCGRDEKLRVWNGKRHTSTSSRLTKQMTGAKVGPDQNLIRCTMDASQRMVAVGSADRFVYVYNRVSKKLMYRLPGHTGTVNDIAFHPTQPILATASSDGSVLLGELL